MKCGDFGFPRGPPTWIARALTFGPKSITATKLLPLLRWSIRTHGYCINGLMGTCLSPGPRCREARRVNGCGAMQLRRVSRVGQGPRVATQAFQRGSLCSERRNGEAYASCSREPFAPVMESESASARARCKHSNAASLFTW